MSGRYLSGVGDSGKGARHCFDGFRQFNGKEILLKDATWLDIPLICPP